MKASAPPLDALLKALSEPTRLRILALLGAGEICVCHIHTALEVPQPTASRHLAHLRKVGLVEDRKVGLWNYYRLRVLPDKALQAVVDAARCAAEGTATMSNDCCRLTQVVKLMPSPLRQSEGRQS